MLKDNIRELESELSREKEFNSSDRKINAEYLVNVLRSFLMTKDASEHSKIVPVLCSILHFHAAETKEICDKWAANTRGLVGWLLPQQTIDNSNSMNVPYNPYMDGVGGLDIY